MVSYSVDFLPICDLLFNFISVASYFCDVAFHIIIAYTFYRDGLNYWFLVVVCAIIVSLFACQTLSMKWYIEDEEQNHQSKWSKVFVYFLHLFQCGVLWRYSKLLFLPMGSSIPLVKREMRNLCILRIVHGFCQGLPLLFVQGFLIATHSPYISEVHKVSLSLSFFGICWSLASFNKNVRAKDIDKLVLTWIGVIFQLLWRLGTVSSRVIALVVYASAFEHWIILVVALHWLCMFLWLLVQNQDSGVLGKTKAAKFLWSFLISYLHNIAYINVEKNANTRLKIAAFYTVTLVENILLVSLWTTSVRASLDFESDERRDVVMTVVLAFLGGLFFMLLYYRLFHTSKISTAFKPGDGDDTSGAEDVAESGFGTKNSRPGGRNGAINSPEKMAMAEYCNNQAVFNCVLNPALRKKKKKMPSVVPPPPSAAEAAAMAANKATKAETPFWKQPLPDQQSEIRLKLQNKHENQLRQLQLIENEIRAGHIKRPNLVQNGFSFQPPPIIQRDPGAVHSYLNIHDPLNDSSGDQGDVDSGDDGFPRQQIYRRKEFRQAPDRRYETPL